MVAAARQGAETGMWRSGAKGSYRSSTGYRAAPASRRIVSVFFFQAEDGIRDKLVTGVQTCALPISTLQAGSHRHQARMRSLRMRRVHRAGGRCAALFVLDAHA